MPFMSARRLLATTLAAAALTTVCASRARASDVEEARRAYFDADFQASAAAFDRVLARANLEKADAATANCFLAALRFMLGSAGQAREHAASCIALDPDARPPDGAPPEVGALFDQVRQETGGRRAALRIDSEGAPTDGVTRVFAELDPSLPGTITTLRLGCGTDATDVVLEEGAPPRVTAAIASTKGTLRCQASALTAAGAALLRQNGTFDLSRAGSGPLSGGTDPADDDDSAPIWPWIAAGGGVVAAAVVVTVLLLTTGGSDDAKLGTTRVEGW
jgi:hypothetical protein